MTTYLKSENSYIKKGEPFSSYTLEDLKWVIKVGDVLQDFIYEELDEIQESLRERSLKMIITCDRKGPVANGAVIGR